MQRISDLWQVGWSLTSQAPWLIGKQRWFRFWWFNFTRIVNCELISSLSRPSSRRLCSSEFAWAAGIKGTVLKKLIELDLMMHGRYGTIWVWGASWLPFGLLRKEHFINFAKKHPKKLSCLHSFTIMDTCCSWSWQVRVNYQAVAQNHWPKNRCLQYSAVPFFKA